MRSLILMPLLALAPGVAPAAPLTFQAALHQAQASAPTLDAATLAAAAARAARGAAGALPDPTLAIGYDSFPISGPLRFAPGRDDFAMLRVGISQSLPNLAKRHAAQARSAADIVAADADHAVEARTVEVGTAVAWIDLAFAQRRLAALDQLLARLDRIVATTPDAVSAGTARPAQTIAGRQALAALQDRRDELVAQVARAKAGLTRWTGDADPQIAGDMPAFPIDPAALRAALDGQPTLRAFDAARGQADADLRVAEADRRPDFGMNVAYQRRDPRFGDYVSAGVTISLPPFTRARQTAQIDAAQARSGRAVAARMAARRALAATLEGDLADHEMHHAEWMRARDTLQPLAEERVRLETASYAAGRAGLVDVADAYAALADATLTTLDRAALVASDGARLALTYRSDNP